MESEDRTTRFAWSPTRLEGMETRWFHCQLLLRASLRPALRGWKLGHLFVLHDRSYRLRPALRGWKLLTEDEYRFVTKSLRPALRGWKLKLASQAFGDGPSLRPALRGWKLEPKRLKGNVMRRLRPALRGWKLLNGQRCPKNAAKSPTRLEGMETDALRDLVSADKLSPTRLEGMETSAHQPEMKTHNPVSDPP